MAGDRAIAIGRVTEASDTAYRMQLGIVEESIDTRRQRIAADKDSTHALQQTGDDDLLILITYPKPPPKAPSG